MVTLCLSLIVSGALTDLSWPANTFRPLYTSCRWGQIQPGKLNTTRCKEWCWNGAQLNWVTWCLNPNHVLNPAALSCHSKIPSTGASPYQFVILKESESAGSELMEFVRVPGCTRAHTHTNVSVQHTRTGRHNMACVLLTTFTLLAQTIHYLQEHTGQVQKAKRDVTHKQHDWLWL